MTGYFERFLLKKGGFRFLIKQTKRTENPQKICAQAWKLRCEKTPPRNPCLSFLCLIYKFFRSKNTQKSCGITEKILCRVTKRSLQKDTPHTINMHSLRISAKDSNILKIFEIFNKFRTKQEGIFPISKTIYECLKNNRRIFLIVSCHFGRRFEISCVRK